MRRKFSRSTLVLLATGSLAMSGAAVTQEQDQVPPQEQQSSGLPPGQIPAVLKAREVEFIYRSSFRLFTCDQLRNHVAVILQALGARQDVKVRANDCETFIDPMQTSASSRPDPRDPRNKLDTANRPESVFDRRPSTTRDRTQSTPVRIQVMMPVEVTPDILAEVDKDKARRELVSRVTGNPGAGLDDPIFFAAERRQVALSHDTIKIEAMDCELLEQMATTVFRALDLKVISQSSSCDPRQRSRILPQLTVEALLPVGFQVPGEQKK